MSDETWTVDTDQLATASVWFRRKAESVEASMKEAKEVVEELVRTSWKGTSADALEEETKSWQLSGQALVDRLNEMSVALADIQSAYLKASDEVQEIWSPK